MAKLFNLARVRTNTTGSGSTIILGAPVAGCLSFPQSGVLDGDIVSFGLIDSDQSEVGRGLFNASASSLEMTILASTNSGSPISLSGSGEIFITALSQDILSSISGSGIMSSTTGSVVVHNTSGVISGSYNKIITDSYGHITSASIIATPISAPAVSGKFLSSYDAVTGSFTQATDSDTIYTGSAPITVAGSVVSHNTSGITAGSYVKVQSDTFGHIVSGSTFITGSDVQLNQLGSSTNKNLNDYFNNIQSSGRISGMALSDSGSSTLLVSSGRGMIKSSTDFNSTLMFFDYSGGSIALTDNALNYIYMDYNGGSPVAGATTDRTTINDYDQFTLGRCYREGSDLGDITASGTNIYNAYRRIHNRLVKKYGFDWAQGSSVSEFGTRSLSVTAGTWYIGNTEIDTAPHTTGSSYSYEIYYVTSGSWTKSSGSQLGNSQYNDITTGLVSLLPNKFANYWVYLCPAGDIYVLYGQSAYNSLAEAQATQSPSSVPNYISANTRLIARISFKSGDTNFSAISDAHLTNLPPGTATNHNYLAGLQGGAVSEYYHLTNAQQSYLTSGSLMSGSGVMSDTTGSTIKHNASGIISGSYNKVLVDTYGHITSGSIVAVPITATSVSGKVLNSYDSTTGSFTNIAIASSASAGTGKYLSAYDATTGSFTSASLTFYTGSGPIDVTGSKVSHSDSGVITGSYNKVLVDNRGHVYAGSIVAVPQTANSVVGKVLNSYDATTGSFTNIAIATDATGVSGRALYSYTASTGSFANVAIPITATAVTGKVLNSYDSTTGSFTNLSVLTAIAGSAIMTGTTGSVVKHDASGVSSGSYNKVIVDTYGHVTSASIVAVPLTATGVSGRALYSYDATTGSFANVILPITATSVSNKVLNSYASTTGSFTNAFIPITATAVTNRVLNSYDSTTGSFTNTAVLTAIAGSSVMSDTTGSQIKHNSSGVSTGSYNKVIVDVFGHVTSASIVAAPITAAGVSGRALYSYDATTGSFANLAVLTTIAGSSVMSDTTGSQIKHNASGVTTGSYNKVIVDVFGHITSASIVAVPQTVSPVSGSVITGYNATTGSFTSGSVSSGTTTTVSAGSGIVILNSGADYNVSMNGAYPMQGRLTLGSGSPVTTSDITGAGTLYYTPCLGNWHTWFDSGSVAHVTQFPEISLALSVTSGSVYDVFCVGGSALELLKWSTTTARATNIIRHNGMYVKSGDITRMYLGTICASGTNTCEDSLTKRFCWNYYNRVNKPAYMFSDSSHTYTSAPWRYFNNSSSNSVHFVVGLASEMFATQTAAFYSTVASSQGYLSVGIDTDQSSFSNAIYFLTAATNTYFYGFTQECFLQQTGYHYIASVEQGAATSATFSSTLLRLNYVG